MSHLPANGPIVALIVAAGSSRRMAGELPKQYRPLAGKALLAHAIERMQATAVDAVRVVIGPGQEGLYAEAAGGLLPSPPLIGGETRQQSVRNGLEAIAAEGGAARILIHDAARPFVPRAVVERLVAALDEAPAAVPVLPVVDSLARASERLEDSVSRENIVRVQTPQAFHYDAILAAHRAWQGAADATDDAQVARAAGLKVAIVAGDAALAKITHEADFAAASRALSASLVSRTGFGFDVHAFEAGTSVRLGGIEIPHSRALKGHSDADVVLHAVTDALLGALAAGDIGDHFPPSDPRWRGAPSSLFIDHARDLVEAQGGRIDHVDVTIICEAPRIGPYRDAMRANLAALLRLPEASVSIKATTTERLGFAGRGEGIAAQALATVRVPERN